jgi:cytidine deaminase
MANRIDWIGLKRAAMEVRKLAYAPYSKFFVGAAVLTKSGSIYSGCNVENASLGLTICAERTAIVNAISSGEREFQAIAVCAHPLGSPCGACRQFIAEFGTDIKILSFDASAPDKSKRWTSGNLLPDQFSL